MIGHQREHVVLDVIVHVPVNEAAERIEIHSSAVQPVINDVFGEPTCWVRPGQGLDLLETRGWADRASGVIEA